MLRLPTALALSIAQLGDPAILKVLAKSLAITLAVFVLAGGVLLTALYRYLLTTGFAFSAEVSTLAAIVLTIIAGWLLFRLVALFVLQFFADEVVRAVEHRHYPAAARGVRDVLMSEELRASFRGFLRTVAFNLVALPSAILLLATGIGTAILFWAVNAWLLGRELQDMVWLRHRRSPEEVQPLNGPTRFALGGVVAALLLVPFANLLAPVLGAASATHLVHRSRHAPA
ncbi:hypothetical protein E3U23_09710 [Erythrobacter litoralis]|uniref:EI24 domain-containing protein n=1 Tax=Erythrobacter litoralis TaxID=39960 RepID=UPI002435EF0F|nr:EI24 domain-containing protein [Erythrobacter litoralis]MDG6079468.1 hypothetical protein [Erythrobacter litoralis]